MARVIMEIRSHCKLEKDTLGYQMNSHISERYFCGKSHHSLWNCPLHLHFTFLHHQILERFKCFDSYLHLNLSFLALCKMSDAFWRKSMYYRKHNQMVRSMWNAILLYQFTHNQLTWKVLLSDAVSLAKWGNSHLISYLCTVSASLLP